MKLKPAELPFFDAAMIACLPASLKAGFDLQLQKGPQDDVGSESFAQLARDVAIEAVRIRREVINEMDGKG